MTERDQLVSNMSFILLKKEALSHVKQFLKQNENQTDMTQPVLQILKQQC